MKRFYTFTFLSLTALLWGCGSDDSGPASASLSFTAPSLELSENAGEVSLTLSLDAALDQIAEITFEVSGTAVLNGDYRLVSPSPVAIPAGETEATITIEVVDDPVLENYMVEGQDIVLRENKTLEVSLTGLSANLIAPESPRLTLTLGDNEMTPNSGMQADLMWHLGPGIPMDEVNLDLYFITDVVIDLGSITNFSFYGDGSRNETGFESTRIDTDAPDKDYYLVVDYLSGEQEVDFEVFIYLPDGIVYAGETFSANESGTAIVFGPFSKSGGSFSASRSTQDFGGQMRPNTHLDLQNINSPKHICCY